MPAPGRDLPIHLTRFVGRGRELEELTRIIASSRLVTLTGAGGSGKTRLAREVAARLSSSYGRVGWVDLAPLGEPSVLAQHTAAALHLPERAEGTPLASLTRGLLEVPTLLVLDNCEHLVLACAEMVESLLRACPHLAVLATSREALGIPSETAWLVPALEAGEARTLFAERAREALSSFVVSDANVAAVDEICRRLDGIPLAIELAASRARVLSPEQIAQRLGDAFRLLTGGSRTALARHRTLRGTMDWSYALLLEREQLLLGRLSVFAGSFALDAVEAVCTGVPLEAEDILDGVAALADKSLVEMEPGEGVVRYRLLETVRQYAAERLHERGELPVYRERHARHYLARLEADAPRLVGGEGEPGMVARLAQEHDNLRSAMAWSIEPPAHAELACRFAASAFWFFYAIAQFRESRQVCDHALALADRVDPILAGRTFQASALTALAQGDYATARSQFEEALPRVRHSDDPALLGITLAKYGASCLLANDMESAERILAEAAEVVGRIPPGMPAVFAGFWRAWAASMRGDVDLAYTLAAPNYAIGKLLGHPTVIGHTAALFGSIEFARGNIEEACIALAESIHLESEAGDGWGLTLALDIVVAIAVSRGRHADGARLLAGIDALRDRTAMALPGTARHEERERLIAALRRALGPDYDRLHAEGRTLSMAQLAQLGLQETARHTTEHRIPSFETSAATLISGMQPAVRPPRAENGAPPLRVLALGALQVFVEGEAVSSSAWGSARPRELLVYLLLHPEGRTKEQVGLAFWPEASAAQLRNSFHVTLHRLRRALAHPEWITVGKERYALDASLLRDFDVVTFEREAAAARKALRRRVEGAAGALERAVELYRGDLLDGEPVGDWHLEHRDRLQRLYLDALMELGACYLTDERHSKAAEAYRRVLARDDLHEEALRALMLSHARAGERAQALRIFQRFADRLRAELDAEPDAETRALLDKVQRGAV